MISSDNNHYVPALKHSWLTRFYDPVVALSSREKVFREQLLAQAEINPGDRVLDLGCGTGSFAILLKTRYPTASVTGLDCDPDILIQAKKKTVTAGVDITFDESMSYSTPYTEGEFDTVFSSLFFHHLKSVEKVRTIKEVYRVLKPGGFFHVCDWGRPSNPVSRVMSLCVQLLDGLEVTRDNIEGRLPSFIKGAGFEEVNQLGRLETVLGTLHFISARKTGI
jgi:ubiquinone/menaquinone biosynthesis C-methylase UbiE